MVKQYPYICVYNSNGTDFSHNGLRILCPTSCTITETLNGEYSLELTHPYDEWGNWQFLIEHNIIKAQGQLFRIYRKNTTMSADGKMERSVSALHIFYDLNFYYIRDTRPISLNGQRALDHIMSHTYTARGGAEAAMQPNKQFTFTSDLKGSTITEDLQYRHTAYYEDMSPTKALIGADNCFVNVWGGELYRDNFNVAINKRRGRDNAFDISYGSNMTEIEQEVDYSDFCGAVAWIGTYKYTVTRTESEETYLKPVITNGSVKIGDKAAAPEAKTLESGDIGFTVDNVTAKAGAKDVTIKIYANTQGKTVEWVKFDVEYDEKLTLKSAVNGGGFTSGTFTYNTFTNTYTLKATEVNPAANQKNLPILTLKFDVASDAKNTLSVKVVAPAGYKKVQVLQKTSYVTKSEDLESTYKGVASLHRLDLPDLPVVPMQSLKLTLTEQDIADMSAEEEKKLAVKEAFDKRVKDYMLANCSPIINYRVKFANLADFEMYKDFADLQSCELGDTGRIYNEPLGISTVQQIVKKTIDGITGETISVELGSLRKSFTSTGRVNGVFDSTRTELIKNEISYKNTWENLGENGYTLESLNSSWNDLAGNVSIIESESEGER